VGALYSAPPVPKKPEVPSPLYASPEGEVEGATTERSSTESPDEGVSEDYMQFTEKTSFEEEVTESPDLSYIPPQTSGQDKKKQGEEERAGGYGQGQGKSKDSLPVENKMIPSHPIEIHVIPPHLAQVSDMIMYAMLLSLLGNSHYQGTG
jgi:hypothetical protein